MVIFGATGDLTKRKLFPALYQLAAEHLLASGFAVLAVGREPTETDQSFREKMRAAIGESDEVKHVDDEVWNWLAQRTFYSGGDANDATAYDAINHKVLAKAVTNIEIRSGMLATAGGVVFTALQDGWVVAYNDETLEELWRFNVGTPLKGSPVTYSIGPKQYLAVQAGGRHLHPVKYDNLENSSYLFVFALN